MDNAASAVTGAGGKRSEGSVDLSPGCRCCCHGEHRRHRRRSRRASVAGRVESDDAGRATTYCMAAPSAETRGETEDDKRGQVRGESRRPMIYHTYIPTRDDDACDVILLS